MTEAQLLCQIARELALIRACLAELVAICHQTGREPQTVTKRDTRHRRLRTGHPRKAHKP
jgi:hypothetical protein